MTAKICGDCYWYRDNLHPEGGFGACFGAPPSVVVAPKQTNLLQSGPPQFGPTSINPAVMADREICGAFKPKPTNGQE